MTGPSPLSFLACLLNHHKITEYQGFLAIATAMVTGMVTMRDGSTLFFTAPSAHRMEGGRNRLPAVHLASLWVVDVPRYLMPGGGYSRVLTTGVCTSAPHVKQRGSLRWERFSIFKTT